MATAMKTDAEKVTKLREMAKDKSLPQEVRNQYLDQATKLEEKGAMKAGVKLAKGGMASGKAAGKTPPMKSVLPIIGVVKPVVGNKAKKPAGPSGKPMMYGGMAEKPMMAKGGSVAKKAKK